MKNKKRKLFRNRIKDFDLASENTNLNRIKGNMEYLDQIKEIISELQDLDNPE